MGVVIYLTANEILEFNGNFVGPDLLRDFGLLDGAVMRPQSSAFGEDAFPTIHEKAAALLHGLARNHPFVDGNKRTAWTATAAFYLVNGYTLDVEAVDVVTLTVDAAEGQIGVEGIAATLKNWAQPFLMADDWVEMPRAGSGEDIEDLIRDIDQNLDNQVAVWAAQDIDKNLKASFGTFFEESAELAEAMWEYLSAGEQPPEVFVQQIRRWRQKLLDTNPEDGEEWVEFVDSIPLFASLAVYEEVCERSGSLTRERHGPSPRRRAKKKKKRKRRGR